LGPGPPLGDCKRGGPGTKRGRFQCFTGLGFSGVPPAGAKVSGGETQKVKCLYPFICTRLPASEMSRLLALKIGTVEVGSGSSASGSLDFELCDTTIVQSFQSSPRLTGWSKNHVHSLHVGGPLEPTDRLHASDTQDSGLASGVWKSPGRCSNNTSSALYSRLCQTADPNFRLPQSKNCATSIDVISLSLKGGSEKGDLKPKNHLRSTLWPLLSHRKVTSFRIPFGGWR